jgi:hypothetical protein
MEAAVMAAISLAATVQFVLVQIPLWLYGYLFGLRIADVGSRSEQENERLQLSLKQVMATVTVIALSLAALRGLHAWDALASAAPGRLARLALVFAMIVGFDVLLAWLAMWGFLSSSASRLRVPLAVGLIAGMTVIQDFVFSELLGKPPTWFVTLWLNLPQFMLLAATFIATRRAGFVLVQTRPGA